jgi:hypothetical protein
MCVESAGSPMFETSQTRLMLLNAQTMPNVIVGIMTGRERRGDVPKLQPFRRAGDAGGFAELAHLARPGFPSRIANRES